MTAIRYTDTDTAPDPATDHHTVRVLVVTPDDAVVRRILPPCDLV